MRILHTSDWHLGASLFGKSRKEEHALFLSWLLETIKERNVGCLLVCGDVFDSSQPSYETIEMFTSFVKTLGGAGVRAVFTGGNHDSARFLDCLGNLSGDTTLAGTPRGSAVLGLDAAEVARQEAIVLEDAPGQTAAIVCVVPFLRSHDVRQGPAADGETPQDREDALAAGVAEYFARAADRAKQARSALKTKAPLICTGHLYVRGSSLSDSESQITVGTLNAIKAEVFSPDFAYVALGHLHTPQIVGDNAKIRYSGSPLPLSFAEAGTAKEVVLLETDGPEIRTEGIRIPCFRTLRTIKGDMDEIDAQIAQVAAQRNPAGNLAAWCSVEYTGASTMVDLPGHVRSVMSGATPDGAPCPEALIIKSGSGAFDGAKETLMPLSLDELSPEKVFDLLLSKRGVTDEERAFYLDMFREIEAEIRTRDADKLTGAN